MKLFAKYNRISILASILVFMAGCLSFYFVLRYVLIRQIDGALHTEQSEITHFVSEYDKLPEVITAYDQQIEFIKTRDTGTAARYFSQKVKTTTAGETEYEWMRVLTFGIHAGGISYQVRVSKSQVETEDLLVLILLIAAGMTGLMLLVAYFINRVTLKRLWQPFYTSIRAIQQYRLNGRKALQLPESDIDEFSLLNKSINTMTGRIGHEYAAVKAFSSNAAHEMQTPLAVISSSLETLMQEDPLLQQYKNPVQTIEQSVNRLTRLNQALLLLARIENRQFEPGETVQLDKVLQQKFNELKELIEAEQLQAVIQTTPVTVTFHQHLAAVIIDNLLINAIRYNYPGGQLHIQLNEKTLTISNTSSIPALDSDRVFERFYRHAQTSPGGSGLGLSIVKQVCELAGFTVEYHFQNNLHYFMVSLS